MDNVIYVEFGDRLSRVLKRKPDARSMINLANQFARRANHAEALRLYRKACQVEPELWEAHYNLGYCLYERRHLAGAIRSFERALSLAPRSSHVRFNLASAFNKAGLRIEAARHWRRYLELEPGGQWAPVARKCLARIEQNTAH